MRDATDTRNSRCVGGGGSGKRMLRRLRRFCTKTVDELSIAGFRAIMQVGAGKNLIARRVRAIPDLESLRTRLGNPKSILCLGNGPSSEDPRLRAVEHDCLFRVNCRWLDRHFLTNPDIVFVGTRRMTRQYLTAHPTYETSILGFRTAWDEPAFILDQIIRPRPGALPYFREYFTADRIQSFLNRSAWGARPTNGAVMIATAVALQPERLIVAGIDLFLHSEGKYPGAESAENCYHVQHNRNVEIQIFERALREFRGEWVSFSHILTDAIASYREQAAGAIA